MASRSALEFKETWNDEALSGLFDGLAHLDLPVARYKPGILCCLLLAFTFICILAFLQPRRRDRDHTRAALQALLTVVTPRCSLWPGRYVKFASAFSSRIHLPLEIIFEDTIDGVVEFRDPVSNLAMLMDSGATVNGYTICVTTGWRWWFRYFEWWTSATGIRWDSPSQVRICGGQGRSSCLLRDCPLWCPPGHMFEVSHRLHANSTTADLCLLASPFDPLASTSSSRAVFCLDYLPHGRTPPLAAGCKLTLEFTAFSLSLRAFSAAQVISAIPFIHSEHPCRRPRTVVSVLELLGSSYGLNLAIDSIINVTDDYERALRLCTSEQRNRDISVKTRGIKAWRRNMFLVALEAACVHRGWIERWAIQVTVT